VVVIYYIINHGKKVGSLNFYKMTAMFPGRSISSCELLDFEGELLNMDWDG